MKKIINLLLATIVILSSCSKEDDLLTPIPTPNTTQNINTDTTTTTTTDTTTIISNNQIYGSEYDITNYSYSLIVDKKNLWWIGCPPQMSDTTITYESDSGYAAFTDNGTGMLRIPCYVRDFEEYAFLDTHYEGLTVTNNISTISIENNKVCLGLYYNTGATVDFPSIRRDYIATLNIIQNTGNTLILEYHSEPEGRGYIKKIRIELQKK